MGNITKKELGAILHADGTADFYVWAPFAKQVALLGSFNGWKPQPMKSEEGYWSAHIDEAEAGQEYKFAITTQAGEELSKNDPYSFQILSAEGDSVLVDTTFEWGDDDDSFEPIPFNQQIIYELHIGTFCRPDASQSGTFATATEKLDYLADLGINMIEIMPINSMFMDRGWGYAPAYLYSIESLYGGRREFLEFVKAAHSRGIGVILDVVYNHFGPNDIDLWRFDGWYENDKGGIYFYNDWRSSTAWGETRPDYGRPEVREYILGTINMWLNDCHVDGLRFDSTIYIRNVVGHDNDPQNDIADGWRLLSEATTRAHEAKPTATLIAEDTGSNASITKPVSEGGTGFSTQWEVSFPGALRAALSSSDDGKRDLSAVQGALTHRYNTSVYERVIYSDSHDSAHEMRLNEEIAPDDGATLYARRRMLIASALVLTAPGMPMLFQGQEFMENGGFNDWHALDWKRAETFAGILTAHKHLIALRKNAYHHTKGLLGQSINIIHLDNQNHIMAYHRWDKGGPEDDVVIVINFANTDQQNYKLPLPKDGKWLVRWNSDWKGYSDDFTDLTFDSVNAEQASGTISIAPYTVLILSQQS